MDHAKLKDILSGLLTHLSLPFDEIKVRDEQDLTRIDIVSNDASRIIGWHGETLNSLQHLVKSVIRAQENMERSPFIVLDIDGYRLMQEDKVRKIAEQKADFVRRTGNRIALAPMSPYFRRIVHLHVANTPAMSDLTTESVGEGEYRQIVMKLKNPKKPSGDATEETSGELSPVIASDDGLENLDV